MLIPVPYRLICPFGVPALPRHLAPIVTRSAPRWPALHRHLAPGTRYSERPSPVHRLRSVLLTGAVLLFLEPCRSRGAVTFEPVFRLRGRLREQERQISVLAAGAGAIDDHTQDFIPRLDPVPNRSLSSGQKSHRRDTVSDSDSGYGHVRQRSRRTRKGDQCGTATVAAVHSLLGSDLCPG